MPSTSILALTPNFCPISLSLGTQYNNRSLNFRERRTKLNMHDLPKTYIYYIYRKKSFWGIIYSMFSSTSETALVCLTHQNEVSILWCPIFSWQFQDVSLFNELISRVNDVLFSTEQLVHLQQLSHALLRDKHSHVCRDIYHSFICSEHPNKRSSSWSNLTVAKFPSKFTNLTCAQNWKIA